VRLNDLTSNAFNYRLGTLWKKFAPRRISYSLFEMHNEVPQTEERMWDSYTSDTDHMPRYKQDVPAPDPDVTDVALAWLRRTRTARHLRPANSDSPRKSSLDRAGVSGQVDIVHQLQRRDHALEPSEQYRSRWTHGLIGLTLYVSDAENQCLVVTKTTQCGLLVC
jgi:hypothetical protein